MKLRNLTYLYVLDLLNQRLSRKIGRMKAMIITWLLVPTLCGAFFGYFPINLLGIMYGTAITMIFLLYLLVSLLIRGMGRDEHG